MCETDEKGRILGQGIAWEGWVGVEEHTVHSRWLKSSSSLDVDMDMHSEETWPWPSKYRARSLRGGRPALRRSSVLALGRPDKMEIPVEARGLANIMPCNCVQIHGQVQMA